MRQLRTICLRTGSRPEDHPHHDDHDDDRDEHDGDHDEHDGDHDEHDGDHGGDFHENGPYKDVDMCWCSQLGQLTF